jgi:hypothetical protein
VRAAAGDVEPVVLDIGQRRESVQARRRGGNGHDGNLSLPRRAAKLMRPVTHQLGIVVVIGRSGWVSCRDSFVSAAKGTAETAGMPW